MESLRRLALNIRKSPYEDHCPPLIEQLFSIQHESASVDHNPLSLGAVAHSLAEGNLSHEHELGPIRFTGVPSLSIENLSRAGDKAPYSSPVPVSTVVTPSTNVSALTPSPMHRIRSASCPDTDSSPIRQSGASPTYFKKREKDTVLIDQEYSADTALSIKRLQETAEFNDGVGRVSFLGEIRDSTPSRAGHRYTTHPQVDGHSHGSATYHETTRPGDRSSWGLHSRVNRTLEGTGITSDMIACLSAVDATSYGASIIEKGEREAGSAAGMQSTLVEEDMVVGLAAEQRPRGRVGSVETAGASTASRGGVSSNSQFHESKGTQSHGDPRGGGYDDDFYDEDDFPLLSPMDQSKVASPSAAGGGAHIGIWERGAGAGSTRSVPSAPPSPSLGGQTKNFDHVVSVSPGRGYRPLPEHPVLYAPYIEGLEQKIREEAAKAAAIEFQALRLQANQTSKCASHLGSREADELRLREDFARELYRVKQQLEDLKARQDYEQRMAQQHAARGSSYAYSQPPLYGGVSQRHRSPLRSSLQDGAAKTINVKVVRDYEEEVVPYPKPVRQQASPQAPTPAYSSSFYTQSPSPKTRGSRRGARSSTIYSSFDTTYRDSFLSESIHSFVSESVE